MTKPTFYYVDAPIGSGKTHALVQYLKTASHLTTIGTQTNPLSIQIEADLLAQSLTAKAIFRDNQPREDHEEVIASSKLYREGCVSGFPILTVNQDVAGRCKDHTENRHLFNDEIASVYERVEIDGLAVFQELVASYFDPINDGTSEFVRLRRSRKVMEVAENGYKDGLLRNADKNIKRVFYRLSDDDFDVYVNREHLKNFKWGLRGWIAFYILMKPSRYAHYRTVTFMGANFTDSLMHLLWRNMVNFVPHPDIKAGYHNIRDKAHLVELYAFHEKDLSSTLLDQVARQNYYDACQSSVASLIGSQAHIHCMNNERKGENHQWTLPKATRLSPDARGLNGFKDINVAVHMAALNEHPDTFGFLFRHCKIYPDEVKIATTYERIYQFIGRVSIRNKYANDRIKIFVGDLGAALFLQEKIRCAAPTVLDIGLERVAEAPKKRGRKKSKPERTPEEEREYQRTKRANSRAKQKQAAAFAIAAE